MMDKTLEYSEAFSEKFSIGSLLYIRLRRVSSRVIDVMYLSENEDYASHVVSLAMATSDAELHKLANKLKALLPQPEVEALSPEPVVADEVVKAEVDIFKAVPTEEDVYREQVSHHYIGSLR